nr:MAG TPA: hypothetical protein [Caudoviricetes sp.]
MTIQPIGSSQDTYMTSSNLTIGFYREIKLNS